MSATEDKYVFHAEWFDTQADVLRRYMLTYYPRDSTIDMYDLKNRRLFLKRSQYAEVTLKDLYIGSVVTILARQLTIIEYADVYTRNTLESSKSKTLVLVKPDAYSNIGPVMHAALQAGFVIARLKMVRMGAEHVEMFCRIIGQMPTPPLLDYLQSDVCVAMELIGADAVQRWQTLMGPASTAKAQSEAPRSLRALYGTDDLKNAVHGSADIGAVHCEVDFFLVPLLSGGQQRSSATARSAW